MGAEVKKRCDLHQFLTSSWVKHKAYEAGVTILSKENYDYLLICALNNCEDKDLENLHDLKESYEKSNQ